jgi:cytochrome c oxidase subunit IV
MTDAHGPTGRPHDHHDRPAHDPRGGWGVHAAHGHEAAAPAADAPAHINWKTYVFIGVILAVVTALEVAAVESDLLPDGVVIPMLLILTAAKFFLVVLYYMHLKVDDPIFGRVFWAPLFLAVLVVIGLILLFHVLPTYGKFSN